MLTALPLPMTAGNMRKIIDSFRSLGASLTIKPTLVEVASPKGDIVFRAHRDGILWVAEAREGLINARFL